MKALTGAWLALVVLSLATVWMGGRESLGLLAAAGILGLALGKAWVIVARFMELGPGPALWRRLLLGWPVLLAVAVLALHPIG
ncbi:cytochrome C oxidase subunit IV family protein [Zestomonas carbonaria]|uniref:Cytochrome C oxidase subunit IV n=1 Tax=Zestomonas carbonaria TaxID=2762745 RepID=A0A7U7ELQ8_9GAMM|nr:cytochrome C oxidase subunit IV family protein [Pseudomonas carbonaria]CAD5107161.1 hypothetical protein PSEWESI4_01432 [Pseudomonas carbonaria]